MTANVGEQYLLILHHDRHRVDRHHGRPLGPDIAQSRARRTVCDGAGARVRRSPQLPNVVRRDLGVGRGLSERRTMGERRKAGVTCGSGGELGIAGNHNAGAGFARRRPRDHALRRVPLSSARALRRPRQLARDADRVGMGDAERLARACGHAVRIRWPAMARNGAGDRMDGRRGALGREPARCGRPHSSVRHRRAHGCDGRPVPDLFAAHQAALDRNCWSWPPL